jgi:beta-ureidopropionase / N-carbamoyl-L-amino-acid hydrolase
MTLESTARINIARFFSTLEESSRIGVGREEGLCRLALTDADRCMRDQFVEWCEGSGLSVTVDAVGNIFGRRAGTTDLPPVLMGSHLDTQVNGGRFDGIVGVLGGLEVVRTLNDLGIETRRPIEVVNWANEEGSRFSPPMLASGCFVGAYDVEWAYGRPSDDGKTFGEELARIGYRGAAPVGKREIDAYFELHIEQGDVLDTTQTQVGVVTHGYTSFGALVEFRGETAHTGPWPMARRRNALVAAARMLTAVDDLGWEFAATGGKATAARLVAWPNKAGTLSDWAEVTCDVRHEDPRVATFMNDRMVRFAAEVSAKTGCESKILDKWNWGGAIFDNEMVTTVRRTAAKLGYSTTDLPSQAGHDAYFLATKYPTAMIFVPCREGITHHNRELSTSAHLDPGLNVLLHAVVDRADQP